MPRLQLTQARPHLRIRALIIVLRDSKHELARCTVIGFDAHAIHDEEEDEDYADRADLPPSNFRDLAPMLPTFTISQLVAITCGRVIVFAHRECKRPKRLDFTRAEDLR